MLATALARVVAAARAAQAEEPEPVEAPEPAHVGDGEALASTGSGAERP